MILRLICTLWAFVLGISMAAGNVLINEMELNPPHGVTEWVELYNDGYSAANISGWTVVISDGGWVGKLTAPSGSLIPSQGYYVLAGSPGWSHQNGGYISHIPVIFKYFSSPRLFYAG